MGQRWSCVPARPCLRSINPVVVGAMDKSGGIWLNLSDDGLPLKKVDSRTMTPTVMSLQGKSVPESQPKFDHGIELDRLERVVSTPHEFDQVICKSLPLLLERASGHTKHYLKATNQWHDDIAHEKFALRWGAEHLERFRLWGRSKVPCRPLFLLDALVAQHHSIPEPFCYHPEMLTPLGRVLDGLVSRAVVSRDALIALYYHWYGMGPRGVIGLAGLNGTESPRIYKNFQRWRESGWQRAMDEAGLTHKEVDSLIQHQRRDRQRFNHKAEQLIRLAQHHYRKSEPDHYPCLSRDRWADMFAQGYGYDYRLWHLVLCRDCLQIASDLPSNGVSTVDHPRVDIQLRP